MAILLLGELEQAAINAAIERARQHPIPLDFIREWHAPDKSVVKLADRKAGFRRPSKPEQVLIPFGYRAAVSFEEQPAGMTMHLSISVEREDPKRMPGVEQVKVIAAAFGISYETACDQGWIWQEEYEPGRHAINLLKLTSPRQEGHA